MAKETKQKKEKKRGTGKAMTATGAVLLAVAVAVGAAGNYFSGVLDTYAWAWANPLSPPSRAPKTGTPHTTPPIIPARGGDRPGRQGDHQGDRR